MLVFLLALIVLLAGSLPWVAMVRPPNRPSWLMAFYLICSANVVLTGYIANSFYLLNQKQVVLTIQAGLGVFGWLIWKRVGTPSISAPFQDRHTKISSGWLRREPALSLFALAITLLYAFALVQIILIPQNNSDSLSTHLSRIGFWHQYGSFLPWPTLMLNQVWYPVNAQLQTYWTLLFLGGDQLVGSVQWLAALISGVGVFGLARLFGFNERQSTFAGLIFLSFPLIALQSTTAQTDLVTMVFFVLAVYFLILGLTDGRNSLLSLSAISIGIGLGVKKSFFLLVPILAILAIIALLQYGKRTYKQLVFWSLNTVLGIALFGAYGYVVNWQYWGGPFGLPGYVDTLLVIPQTQLEPPKVMPRPVSSQPQKIEEKRGDFPGSEFLLELAYNTPRLLYQSLDTSGLPRPLDGYAHKVKMRVAAALFHWIGFDEIEGSAYTAPGHIFSFSDKNINEESHAWYGPMSVLLLFPALVIGFRRGIKSRDYLWLAPGVALLVFLPMEILLRPGWDPYQGRYFAPLIALGSPLMAHWFRSRNNNAIYEWVISVSAVVFLFVTLLYNPSKPTLGKYADEFHIWDNDRIFIQTIQRKNDRDMYYMVDKFVPAGSTLGFYTPLYILDYPLFGDDLERRLVPIVSPSRISDSQWLREQGIDYLLLPAGDGYPVPPPEYQPEGKLTSWVLHVYTSKP